MKKTISADKAKRTEQAFAQRAKPKPSNNDWLLDDIDQNALREAWQSIANNQAAKKDKKK